MVNIASISNHRTFIKKVAENTGAEAKEAFDRNSISPAHLSMPKDGDSFYGPAIRNAFN